MDRGGNVARAGDVRELVLSAVFKTVCGALLRRPGWVRFPSIPARFQHTTVSAGSVAAEIGTALAQESRGVIRIVRYVYIGLIWLLFADLCLQFYFAAYGVFSTGAADFGYHSRNAGFLAILMLVTLAVSVAARLLGVLPWTRVLQHLVLPVLFLLQLGLFLLGHALGGTVEHPISWLLGFHGLNGVLMLLLSLRLALLARQPSASVATSTAAKSV